MSADPGTDRTPAGIPRRIGSFDHDGLEFDVIDEGPIDGQVVVLLHGFPERATSWREVAPRLHAAGLRTLAPDQRGYSRGARPSRRRDYDVDLLVGDVAALIRRAVAPVHLVGHDWGAIVAWRLAATHPELVASLTTFSVPHPEAFVRALGRSSQGLRSWYVLAFQAPGVAERMARRPGGAFDVLLRRTGMTRDDVERCRREVVDDGALPGALGWYRALPFALGRTGGRITVPTTHVWSDGDTAIGPWAPRRTGEWCDGPYEYVELAGVSHWIPTQAPAAAAEAILSRIGG